MKIGSRSKSGSDAGTECRGDGTSDSSPHFRQRTEAPCADAVAWFGAPQWRHANVIRADREAVPRTARSSCKSRSVSRSESDGRLPDDAGAGKWLFPHLGQTTRFRALDSAARSRLSQPGHRYSRAFVARSATGCARSLRQGRQDHVEMPGINRRGRWADANATSEKWPRHIEPLPHKVQWSIRLRRGIACGSSACSCSG